MPVWSREIIVEFLEVSLAQRCLINLNIISLDLRPPYLNLFLEQIVLVYESPVEVYCLPECVLVGGSGHF